MRQRNPAGCISADGARQCALGTSVRVIEEYALLNLSRVTKAVGFSVVVNSMYLAGAYAFGNRLLSEDSVLTLLLSIGEPAEWVRRQFFPGHPNIFVGLIVLSISVVFYTFGSWLALWLYARIRR